MNEEKKKLVKKKKISKQTNSVESLQTRVHELKISLEAAESMLEIALSKTKEKQINNDINDDINDINNVNNINNTNNTNKTINQTKPRKKSTKR